MLYVCGYFCLSLSVDRQNQLNRCIEAKFALGRTDLHHKIEDIVVPNIVRSRSFFIHFTVFFVGRKKCYRKIEDIVKSSIVKSRCHCIIHLHETISELWLADGSAVLCKQKQKKGNKVFLVTDFYLSPRVAHTPCEHSFTMKYAAFSVYQHRNLNQIHTCLSKTSNF